MGLGPIRSSSRRDAVACIIHDTNQPQRADRARPFLYALTGTVLLAIAGVCFVNLNEGPQSSIVLTVLFAAPGLYLLIAGAVARGNFASGR